MVKNNQCSLQGFTEVYLINMHSWHPKDCPSLLNKSKQSSVHSEMLFIIFHSIFFITSFHISLISGNLTNYFLE